MLAKPSLSLVRHVEHGAESQMDRYIPGRVHMLLLPCVLHTGRPPARYAHLLPSKTVMQGQSQPAWTSTNWTLRSYASAAAAEKPTDLQRCLLYQEM